ncbi:MAG: flagellar hook-basal body complex protein [Acutalibacter sp.]|jgi:flagellar hook protein FlgE
MTGAMNAAIAGLKAHMNKLNVIGNNIANVNTYGYKPGRVVFKDSLYTTMTAGSDGSPTTGGINPSQIGYGVQIGSIDLDMAAGDYSPTGRALDTYIDGDGFFLVGGKDTSNVISYNDPDSLKSLTLTRVGTFNFDQDGYLVDNAGNCVYGFRCIGYETVDGTQKAVFSDQLVPLRLPGYGEKVDQNAGQDTEVEYEVKWPSDGRIQDNGDGTYTYDNTAQATSLEEAADDAGNVYDRVVLDGVSIDPGTGAITGTIKDSDQTITVGYIALGVVDNPNGVTHQQGPYYKAEGGAGGVNVTTIGGIGETIGIDHVNGSLADDQTTLPDSMRIGSSGTTSLITGGLEMSKTDLATEITEMITTQRGYQANTRIVTVTDSMLEELVNMKR